MPINPEGSLSKCADRLTLPHRLSTPLFNQAAYPAQLKRRPPLTQTAHSHRPFTPPIHTSGSP